MRVTKASIYEVILFHIYILVYCLTFSHKDEWGPTVALLAIAAALVIIEYLRTHLFVSPILIWYVFWLGVIAIGRMDLDLYPFYRTWTEDLLRLIVLNTLVFFWCYWAGELTVSKITPVYKRPYMETVNGELLSDITILLLAAACAAFAVNVVYKGVIPQLTTDPNSTRVTFVKTKYYKIVSLLRFVFALVPAAVKKTGSRSKKLVIIVLALLFVAEEMLSGWRTYTLQALILLLSALFIMLESGIKSENRKLPGAPPRKAFARAGSMLILAACAAAAMLFAGYIALYRDGVMGALKDKLEYVLYILDMYIAPNFLNFQNAMETVEPAGVPVYTTVALWSILPGAQKIWDVLPEIDQSIGAFNVSTYLLHPWGDYGTAGTLVWSGLIALVSGGVFSSCRRSPTIFSTVLLGLMNITVFVLHNNLFLRATAVFIWLGMAAVISIFLYMRGSRKNGNNNQPERAL